MFRSGIYLRALLAVTLLTTACRADVEPAPKITDEQAFIAEQQATLAEELRQAPTLPARPLSEIIRLRYVKGELGFELLAKDVADAGTIPLSNLSGVCLIQRFGAVPFEQDAMRISIHVVDADRARATQLELSSFGGRFSFDITLETATRSSVTQFIIGRTTPFETEEVEAKFYTQIVDDDGASSGPSIPHAAETSSKLIAGNHAHLLTYTGEGFRLLRSMHLLAGMDEREVRHLLAASRQASADVGRQLDDAIAKMRAAPDAGEKDLRAVLSKAGPSAAAMLMRLPRQGWSADVTMRVDTILSGFMPNDPSDLDLARTQPSRLLDLLYWPDAGIRKSVLEQIEASNGRAIGFDPMKDPYEQAALIEAFRTKLSEKP